MLAMDVAATQRQGLSLDSLRSLWRGENRFKVALAAFILTYIVIMTLAQVNKYKSLGMGYDLGIYEQVIWNTAHGRLFATSNFKYTDLHLGADVIPLELVLAIPYALVPSTYTLLFLETVAVALGAIPLYWLGRDKLGAGPALGVAFAYLVYVPIHFLNLYEFQPRAFAIGLVFALYYFLWKERFVPFILMAILLLMTRSDVSILIAMFGVYAFFWKKPWRFSVTPLVLGISWFILAFFVIVPHFNTMSRFQYLSWYKYLGNSPTEILTTVVTQPFVVANSLTIPPKLTFLRDVYAELAFLPLLRPDILIVSLPTLALNLLSSVRIQWDIRYQYNAVVYPVAFIGTILAVETSSRWSVVSRRIAPARLKNVLVGIVITSNLLAYIWIGDPAVNWLVHPPAPSLVNDVAALVRQIPPDAPLAASNLLGAQVARREKLYFFPPRQEFYTDQAMTRADYIFVDTRTDSSDPAVHDLRTNGEWELLTQRDRFLLFRRIAR